MNGVTKLSMCIKSNWKNKSLIGLSIRVKSFSDDLGTVEEVPIGLVLISYVYPLWYNTFIIIFNEVLLFWDKLKYFLINSNQIREYRASVYDVPKQHNKTSSDPM